MSDERLLERFVRLCEIPSPTGSERAVADAVSGELRELGVEVSEDDAAGPGPRRRRQPDRAGPGHGGRLGRCSSPTSTPSRTTARSRSSSPTASFAARGETILGADNKAAVTVLVELAARHAAPAAAASGSSWSSRSPRRTACAARRSSTSARCARRFGFVLDHASPIGEVIDGRADLQAARSPSSRGRGARRDPPRGRPQRDRGRRGGGRGDESSAASTRRPPRTSA